MHRYMCVFAALCVRSGRKSPAACELLSVRHTSVPRRKAKGSGRNRSLCDGDGSPGTEEWLGSMSDGCLGWLPARTVTWEVLPSHALLQMWECLPREPPGKHVQVKSQNTERLLHAPPIFYVLCFITCHNNAHVYGVIIYFCTDSMPVAAGV